MDGQLFRSVEGQAASDEEEEGEEKWQEERSSLAEVKTLLACLSNCKSGYVCLGGGWGGSALEAQSPFPELNLEDPIQVQTGSPPAPQTLWPLVHRREVR